VVAPCCHKQLRPQLDAHAQPKDPILRHGVYRERIAETVTDSLRALLLELAGYKVQVFEFIGGEHTSKNVMITAVKMRRRIDSTQAIEKQIQSLAEHYGIRYQKLAQWMQIDLLENVQKAKTDKDISSKTSNRKLTRHRMPPRSR